TDRTATGTPPSAFRRTPRCRDTPRGSARSAARSSVARPAGGQLRRRLDPIFGHQLAAERRMVGRRPPVEIINLLARPEVRRGIAVAVEAELRLERLSAIGQRHLVDAAVAFDAGDPLGDVDVVAEINIV